MSDQVEVNDKKKDSKQILLSIIGVAILIVAVVGISFAVFSYSKKGDVENVITTGSVTLEYDQPDSGISLSNAAPIADAAGKIAVSGSEDVGLFDFAVKANITGEIDVSYKVVAVRNTDIMTSDMVTACNAIDLTKVDTSLADTTITGEETQEEQAIKTATAAYRECTLVPDSNIRLYIEKGRTDESYTSENVTTASGENAYEPITGKETPAPFVPGEADASYEIPAGAYELASGVFSSSTTLSKRVFYRLRMWVAEDYKVDSVPRRYSIKVNVYGKGNK